MILPEKEALIKQREPLMVEMENVMRGESKRFKTVTHLAEFAGYTARTLYRMRKRWLECNRKPESLLPRKAGPRGHPYGRAPKDYERMIVKMHRRLGWTAPLIAAYLKAHNIANPSTGRPLSQRSCYDVLKRHPWPRKPDKKEVVRYEKKNPGELGHMDMKKLPNIKGENPRGKVATYGQIAAMAGNRRGARQVVWVLNSSSQKEALPTG